MGPELPAPIGWLAALVPVALHFVISVSESLILRQSQESKGTGEELWRGHVVVKVSELHAQRHFP